MKKFLLGIVVGMLLASLTGIIIVFSMIRLAEPRVSVPQAATLVLRLDGDLPETPPVTMPFAALEARTPQTVYSVWEALRKAAVDERVKAVVLMPQGLSAGWAKLDELRTAVENFKKSGKPVYAYLRSPGTREYYVATAADRIYLGPEEVLNMKGLRAEMMFFKGTLDKLGVQMEIETAGKYKDAGDMFRRTNMSPETREVMESVLDEVYGNLLQTIADSRKKSPEEVRSIMDQGPFLAVNAMRFGLVDDLIYEDEMYNELKKAAKLDKISKLSMRDYANVSPASLKLSGKKKIAILVGEGMILRGESTPGFGESSQITSESFSRLVRQVRDDNSIDGVILRVDSPGGDAIASDMILREVKLLSKKKPIVISMSDVAASGGYYIAMSGDTVLAYPRTITGSIGVIFGKPNLRGFYDKIGVQKDMITRGRFAAIDTDYRPFTEPERAKLKEGIDNVYHTFLQHVADGRRTDKASIEPLAQGRVWLGSQAKKKGLVDELGGLDRAIEVLKEKANISKDENVRLVVYPQPKSFFEVLMSRPADVFTFRLPFAPALEKYQQYLEMPSGYLRLMPYQIDIQ
jgi:protease IV